MPLHTLFRPAAFALALAAGLSLSYPFQAHAQTAAPTFTPSVGQEGKDVIWVPTPPELIQRMLTVARVTPKDFLVDLGAGDGRIAIAAAKRGVRAMGIEYNPEMVDFANRAAKQAGVFGEGAGKATIVHGDIFEKDFSQATVVTMYLLTALNLRLRPKLLEMKPGTRLVAHQFGMGEWEPDETSYVDGRPAHLWIVPAKAAGTWSARLAGAEAGKAGSFVLQLEQTFQKVSGSATFGKLNTSLREAHLQGDALRFVITDPEGRRREFTGRISGDRLEGEARGAGPVQRWQATRSSN
jgi:hypothetical protein